MKLSTKIIRPLCGALLMLLSLAGVWRWYSKYYTRFPAHRIPSLPVFETFRMDRTQKDLVVATRALENFYKHYQKLPINRPNHEEQFSITLGHELNGVRPGIGGQNIDGIVFWNLPVGEQRDGWGNCYHFYFDQDGDGLVKLGSVPIKRSFVIWSDGPNRRDDSGEGDDLRNW